MELIDIVVAGAEKFGMTPDQFLSYAVDFWALFILSACVSIGTLIGCGIEIVSMICKRIRLRKKKP